MKESTRNRLYKIDRTVRKVLNIVTVLFFVLLITAAFNTPWKQTLVYAFFSVGAVWALLIICRLCLSPFVKSDEEEIGSRLFERPLMEYIFVPEEY